VVRVGCQLGHVPRTSGKTGTGGCCGETEQDYVKRLFNTLEPKLQAAGHTPIKILADPPSYPAMDVFVAFHCDGSDDSSSRGCSFGFHDDLNNAAASKAFGNRWRAEHNAAGFPGGNRPTNYTGALAHYYALRPASEAGADQAIVVEFGFLTNRADNDWLIENVDRVANALVRTVVAFHGGDAPPSEEELSVSDADEIMTFLRQMKQDMVVFGTTGLEKTVEDFATRQRETHKKLDGLASRLEAIERHLNIPS